MEKYFIALKKKLIAFWEQEEMELNFWRALLLLISINLVYVFCGMIAILIFKVDLKTNLVFVSSTYLYFITFVPFLYWIAIKTNIRFKEFLYLPDLLTVTRMIIIIILMIVVFNPLFDTNVFFGNLMNHKLRITGGTLLPWIPWISLTNVLFWPIIEEFFFRGIVLNSFLKRYSPAYAILLPSLLFALHHYGKFIGVHAQNPFNIGSYIFMGILFGILFYKTKSLNVTILALIFCNINAFLQYEYIELNITTSIIHLSIYIIATVLLVYLLKKDWKEVKTDWLLKSENDSQYN